MKLERIAAFLLVATGLLTLGTGAHFLFFRPAMLPEDVRFTGMQPEMLRPEMVTWLQIVFRTWGAFLAGFGVLMLSVASYLLTARISLLKWGTSLALLVAFGRFLASNWVIGSDFLPFVGGLSILAALTALMLHLQWRRPARERAPRG